MICVCGQGWLPEYISVFLCCIDTLLRSYSKGVEWLRNKCEPCVCERHFVQTTSNPHHKAILTLTSSEVVAKASFLCSVQDFGVFLTIFSGSGFRGFARNSVTRNWLQLNNKITGTACFLLYSYRTFERLYTHTSRNLLKNYTKKADVWRINLQRPKRNRLSLSSTQKLMFFEQVLTDNRLQIWCDKCVWAR